MSISTNFKNKIFKWSSPSNIALIKYWGKKENQLPQNPSLSITLKNSVTTTSVEVVDKLPKWINFTLEGQVKDDFVGKIENFLERLGPEWSFLRDYSLKINSSNTFPHSSGMASSASAMSALALCLLEMKKGYRDQNFMEQASFMARLGSGSACRSLFKGMSIWGDDKDLGSDNFGKEYNSYHAFYEGIQDTVLIISSERKSVSSTLGHELLNTNLYADTRYKQAKINLKKLKETLNNQDFKSFASIVEEEALSLHAMMMTSNPSYILMKPDTLKVIEKVRAARKNGLDICFTLDAGPNVHLLYPKNIKNEVISFIKKELLIFCENERIIEDEMGEGPKRLTL